MILSLLTSIEFIRNDLERIAPVTIPTVSSFRLYHRSGWRVIKTIIHGVRVYSPRGGEGGGEGAATRTTETQGKEWREAACMHIRGCIEYN